MGGRIPGPDFSSIDFRYKLYICVRIFTPPPPLTRARCGGGGMFVTAHCVVVVRRVITSPSLPSQPAAIALPSPTAGEFIQAKFQFPAKETRKHLSILFLRTVSNVFLPCEMLSCRRENIQLKKILWL